MELARKQRIAAEDWCGVRQAELNRFVSELRVGQACRDLLFDLGCKLLRVLDAVPAGVDQHRSAWLAIPVLQWNFNGRLNPVAGHPGGRVNNRYLPPSQAVHQGRFADVRSADDRNLR